ncbi:hypothetical protein [Candidatus Amarolinea aalborgensis]|jgi:hypothetical protein|uniref:hypothetical protein n=1 Tax=Candidatus Amarolinea aalborgensis TaxID=2249329 RepID=UPI003BFA3569
MMNQGRDAENHFHSVFAENTRHSTFRIHGVFAENAKISVLARWVLMMAALALTLGLWAGPARAEGPGTGGSRIFISDKAVGNYSLLVWAGPSPPQVGRYTVYVRVSDLGGHQLRDGLQVTVRATEEANSEVTDSEANHQNAGNSLDYAAHFQLPRKGYYAFAVTVKGAAGDAEVSFRDRVVATISFGLISAIAGPFIVIIGAIFWYMWSRQSQKQPAAGPE